MKKTLSLILALALALSLCSTAAWAEEEPRTIKMLLSTRSFDMNTDYVAGLLEEITGYKVNYEYYSDDNQLALEVASGTDADIIQTTPAMFQTLYSQGALKNLSPIIEASYPEILEEIYEPCLKYATGEDGGLYAIASSNDAVYDGGLLYRADIFAEHGYTEPNTIEEFHALLTAIKNDTGLIPLTTNSSWINGIASAFGLTYNLVIDKETGDITSYLYDDAMKEYLAWMHQAYTEGLLDVDLPVNTSSVVSDKLSAGEAVMTVGGHTTPLPLVTALRENGDEDAEFKGIIELEDAQGVRHIAKSNGLENVYVIPVTAKDEDVEYTLGMVASRLHYHNYCTYNVY